MEMFLVVGVGKYEAQEGPPTALIAESEQEIRKLFEDYAWDRAEHPMFRFVCRRGEVPESNPDAAWDWLLDNVIVPAQSMEWNHGENREPEWGTAFAID